MCILGGSFPASLCPPLRVPGLSLPPMPPEALKVPKASRSVRQRIRSPEHRNEHLLRVELLTHRPKTYQKRWVLLLAPCCSHGR